jgi:lycopene beta-cyclase
MAAPASAPAPVVILGAGLAGLSLADALLDRDPRIRMVLLDGRTRWGRDRTWGTWLTGPLRFAGLASHRWEAWRVAGRGTETVARAPETPYIHIDARDLYGHVLRRLAAAPHAELRPGEPVRAVRRTAGRLVVETDRGRVPARTVIDARGAPARPPGATAPGLLQRFLGWEVELAAPGFDPAVMTLMDLRGARAGTLTFFYVLPFSARRALVEHTTIGADGPGPRARREAVAAEIRRLTGARTYRIVHEEQGVIPMGTAVAAAAPRLPGIAAVGGAAGAIRASSGYAFTRTQRHVERVADALLADRTSPPFAGAARYALLDQLFLTAVRRAPDGGEALLWEMARRLDGPAFARFMTDASPPWDDARLGAALPPVPMAAAVAEALPGLARSLPRAAGRLAAQLLAGG